MRKTAIGIPVMLIVTYILVSSEPPWSTPGAAIAIYGMLAFLTITITSCAVYRIRTNPTISNKLFATATGTASILLGGASIFYVLIPEQEAIHVGSSGIFLNLVAFALTGLTILFSSYLDENELNEKSLWHRRIVPWLFVVLGVGSFVISMYIARLPIDTIYFIIAGYFLGGFAIFSFFFSAYLLAIRKEHLESHDKNRLIIAYILLAFSSAIHTYILPAPNNLWILSISLMAMAFIIAIMATGFQYLSDIGLKRDVAYGISLAISLIVVLPFIFTHFLESILPSDTYPSLGATIVIHLGGTVFAGSLAFALYKKSKYKTVSIYPPIIALLLYWTVAEASLFATSLIPNYILAIGSQVPYIIGTIVTLVFLSIANRRILGKSVTRKYESSLRLYIGLVFLFISVVIFGLVIQSVLTSLYPSVFNAVPGIALMLSLSFFSLYTLVNLLLSIASEYAGEITFDGLAAGATSIWIVTIILKANFSIYTVGWWAAEAVTAISSVLLPFFLILFYLDQNREAKLLRSRSSVLSELVIESIGKHHAQAMNPLDELSKDVSLNEKRLDGVSRAIAEIARADELSRILGVLVYGDKFENSTLEPMDLVESTKRGFARAFTEDGMPKRDLQFETREVYLVLANSLLLEVFEYLFSGVYNRIGPIESISIDIEKFQDDRSHMLKCSITMETLCSDVDLKCELFDRYTQGEFLGAIEFAYAKRLINLFDGEIFAYSIKLGPQQLSSVFEILLPSAKASD